jgi:hypothetical protein
MLIEHRTILKTEASLFAHNAEDYCSLFKENNFASATNCVFLSSLFPSLVVSFFFVSFLLCKNVGHQWIFSAAIQDTPFIFITSVHPHISIIILVVLHT